MSVAIAMNDDDVAPQSCQSMKHTAPSGSSAAIISLLPDRDAFRELDLESCIGRRAFPLRHRLLVALRSEHYRPGR